MKLRLRKIDNKELKLAREIGSSVAEAAVSELNDLSGGKKFSGENGILVAQGDSWFDYPFYNVLTYLKWKHGYKTESVASNGKWLESMAFDQVQINALGEIFQRLSDEGKSPKAILLSGGGNDISGDQLTMLLNHRKSKSPELNEVITKEVFANRLRLDMVTLISAASTLYSKIFGEPQIPIFIHGYDHPVPDGRGYFYGVLAGPWLKPSFVKKGFFKYNSDPNAEETYDIELATNVIKELIDVYNAVLKSIPGHDGMDQVHYVNLVGTLRNSINDYKDDWGNELHPTRSGFKSVADVFAMAIDSALGGPEEANKVLNKTKSSIIDETLKKDLCAEVVFGETGILRAPGGNEDKLADGRKFIASVAYDRYLKDTTRFAKPQHPTPEELKDESIKKHWDLCKKAAEDGQNVAIGNCRHFVIWPSDDNGKSPTKNPSIPDSWPYSEANKIKESYGPFTQVDREDIYIFKYCGVQFI